MCRWIVYQGPAIYLDRILLEPGHSLLAQALHAREIEWPTNGDGYGVGWYASRDEPGLIRDVLPVWNDTNLVSIAKQVESPLFFAHIRKATEGGIQRSNCHPFTHGRWLFQHNGTIPGFSTLRQRLYAQIDPQLFQHLEGSTDSECMFLLALTFGLRDDPAGGLREMVRVVEEARRDAGIEEAFQCTCATSDGARTWALRYTSFGVPRTLYYSDDRKALCDFEACETVLPRGAVILASEPLGAVGHAWTPVAPSSLIRVEEGRVVTEPFELAAA